MIRLDHSSWWWALVGALASRMGLIAPSTFFKLLPLVFRDDSP